jgi:hypothetical protein
MPRLTVDRGNIGLTPPRAMEPFAGPQEPGCDDPNEDDPDGDGRVVERLRVDCGVTPGMASGQHHVTCMQVCSIRRG